MATAALDRDALKGHVGRKQTATDVLHAGPVNLLRLALGRPEPELHDGDALPPAWLALYFLPRFATATSRVVGADGLVAVEDERRTVFREEVKAGERNQAPRREPAPDDVPWRRQVTPDPVLLFRYSALTFNSHRIHYDRAWAMDVEGYPGLVVHGPLTTTLLVDFARDSNPGRRLVGYATQARAPLFDTAPFELRGRPTGRGGECWAVTPEGTIAMSCEVDLD